MMRSGRQVEVSLQALTLRTLAYGVFVFSNVTDSLALNLN